MSKQKNRISCAVVAIITLCMACGWFLSSSVSFKKPRRFALTSNATVSHRYTRETNPALKEALKEAVTGLLSDENLSFGHTGFISDMPLLKSAVGYGKLGLKDEVGFEGKHVKVKGIAYYNSVSMHTFAAPRFSFATFDVGGGRGERSVTDGPVRHFSAHVAINDGNNFFGRAGSPVTFILVGAQDQILLSANDGSVLWQSRPIQKTGDVDTCKVDIPSWMNVLRLEAHASSSNACSHAVWVDPQLVDGEDTDVRI